MIPRERLSELLRYDEETGEFFWLNNRKKNPFSGQKAGTLYKAKNNPGTGYIAIIIDGKRYLAHRLVWLWVHGYIPDYDLDHDDGDGLNNRIGNLRECTVAQNRMNSCRLNRRNKSGYKGVFFDRKFNSYRAYVSVNGKSKYVGSFDCGLVAARAYDQAALEHYGSFAKTNEMLGLI